MRAGANFSVEIWRGNAHLAKEHIGKFLVVMLTGMHKDGLDGDVLAHFTHERRDLHQIRSCTNNIENRQRIEHLALTGASIAFSGCMGNR